MKFLPEKNLSLRLNLFNLFGQCSVIGYPHSDGGVPFFVKKAVTPLRGFPNLSIPENNW